MNFEIAKKYIQRKQHQAKLLRYVEHKLSFVLYKGLDEKVTDDRISYAAYRVWEAVTMFLTCNALSEDFSDFLQDQEM